MCLKLHAVENDKGREAAQWQNPQNKKFKFISK